MYDRESLETLKQRVDLIDLIGQYVPLKKVGVRYETLCPFHPEKTPSFGIQKGDTHYHCFGCQAHGDAITFLMEHQHLTFVQAVETLAERYHVGLERTASKEESSGFKATEQRDALERATQLYQYALLHTNEGQVALQYLYRRGIDLSLIQQFRLGWAPSQPDYISTLLKSENIPDPLLQLVGLVTQRRSGSVRDFFSERIIFPVEDARGHVVAFSARKIREETYGGKYINTPETPLFKKSRILFGLGKCRREIAKGRHAIIAEGQIDAIRLISSGYNYAVASQGTAFGESHVEELSKLGIESVTLAFDGDRAGQDAAVKVGNLFQRTGIDTRIVQLPEGSDPDGFIQEHGREAFDQKLKEALHYLPFLYSHLSQGEDLSIAAVKTRIVYAIAQQIRGWSNPVIVHESLKELSALTRIPEEMLGVEGAVKRTYIGQRTLTSDFLQVNPQRIQESVLLQWLIYSQGNKKQYFSFARQHLPPDQLRDPPCRQLYTTLLELEEKDELDTLTITSQLDTSELQELFCGIMDAGANKEHGAKPLIEIVKR
ncbi:MAG: DNA primase, partial [Chlamydiia bacterium]|nr:DNA primase [Chlamydiia bacterium]